MIIKKCLRQAWHISSMLLLTIPLIATAANETLSPAEATTLGEKAYIFAYPLVLMDVTKQVMTNVPMRGTQAAPINQFANMPVFPDASFKNVVRPNADTLYSIAWLNLSKEPLILHVPDTNGRYYLMPMLDAWTNVFASPGKRTTGTKAGDFAIVGPKWRGSLPRDVKEIKAPTNTVWIIGRIQTNGIADYADVNAIQKQFKLTPLHMWSKDYQPAHEVATNPQINMKLAPAEQVAHMDAKSFLNHFALLLKANAHAAADTAFIKDLAKIGVVAGKEFDSSKLDANTLQAIEQGIKNGIAKIKGGLPEGKEINGWSMFLQNMGSYGTNYLQRARVAYFGLGANLPEDAIYPSIKVDAEGIAFNGKKRYVMHFNKGELPPNNAFWSVTLYNAKQLFAKNPIQRYTIGSRDPLIVNADGSVDIFIQHANPGKDKEANWLPAPKGIFDLTMRIYWPKQEALQGHWSPPAVKALD